MNKDQFIRSGFTHPNLVAIIANGQLLAVGDIFKCPNSCHKNNKKDANFGSLLLLSI